MKIDLPVWTATTIVLLSLFQSPPVEPSPSCDAQPSDFQAPAVPACRGIMDWWCALECMEAYKKEMADATNRHCERAIDIEADYEAGLLNCNNLYWSCIAVTPPWQWGDCNDDLEECNNDEALQRHQSHSASNNTLAWDSAVAASGFEACCADCCEVE